MQLPSTLKFPSQMLSSVWRVDLNQHISAHFKNEPGWMLTNPPNLSASQGYASTKWHTTPALRRS